MDIGTGSGNTFAWQTVWNMVVPGAGSSLDGTVIEFGSMDLTAVRLAGLRVCVAAPQSPCSGHFG